MNLFLALDCPDNQGPGLFLYDLARSFFVQVVDLRLLNL
mgnify:CR=1 FL=1